MKMQVLELVDALNNLTGRQKVVFVLCTPLLVLWYMFVVFPIVLYLFIRSAL